MLSSIISNKIDVLLLSETTIDQTFQKFWKTKTQKQPPEVFCKKRFSYKFRKIHRKTPVPEPKACNFIKKESLTQVFSCEFCKISKNTFFYRTPPDDCFCRQEFSGWGYNVSFKLLKTEILEFNIDVLSVETKKVANVLRLKSQSIA